MDKLISDGTIIKIQTLLSYNEYPEELINILEDLITLKSTNGDIKSINKKDAVNFYLDFVLLCIRDYEVENSERSGLVLLKRLFKIKEENIHKYAPEKVKQACNFLVKKSLIKQYNIKSINDDIQWALGLSYDQLTELGELEIDKENVFTQIDQGVVKKEVLEHVTLTPAAISPQNPSATESTMSAPNVLFQKVSPSNFLLGLCALTGYYVYEYFDNLYLGIAACVICIILVHYLIFSIILSLGVSGIAAYFIYDFSQFFTDNIAVKLGLTTVGFLLVFGKFFQYSKEKIMQATENARTRYIPKNVRLEVYNRDRGECVDCGSTTDLEYDHIIPFQKGGANTTQNIQLLCQSCNRKKQNKIDG